MPMFFGGNGNSTVPRKTTGKRGVVGFFENGRLSHNSSNLVEKESTTLHEIAAVFIGYNIEPCGKAIEQCVVFLNIVGPFRSGIETRKFVAYSLNHKITELRKFDQVRVLFIRRKWGLQLVSIEKLPPEDECRNLLK
ncbi:uncharacterized protein LOC111245516 [Varroa destructor]|uniref:Uncharacterized protein n=1 Tax=Varroa destructor TaxID=109461 RepID=A0A7M7M529_VARDE|nr:uncharacterized protein LOC111245516 [Varroa destructor]